MARRLVCAAPGRIEWQEAPARILDAGEVRVRPAYGVEKHGTMAAFVEGYANERGRWDADARLHRPEGVLWSYPVPLGNMQFGTTDEGEAVAWWGPFQDEAVVRRDVLRPLKGVGWRDPAMVEYPR